MDSSTKQNIKVTFERIKGAFDHLNFKEAHEYYLTLGNVNEIHMMKKDATKSVFLGRIFTDPNASSDDESRKIWAVIGNYFRKAQPVVEEPQEEVKKTAKGRKSTKKEEVVATPAMVEIPEVPEDFADDDDTTWVDTIQ